MAHCDLYREQLGYRYPLFGHALWEPTLVDVGDVGCIRDGKFLRLFNALHSGDHPSNLRFGVPEYHTPLVPAVSDHLDKGILKRGHYCSAGVCVADEPISLSRGPDEWGVTFSNKLKKGGAVLYLPADAQRHDTLAREFFGRWMLKHIESWIAFAQRLVLGIKQMEEIVLVTGCHRTRSWANIAFLDGYMDARASFNIKKVDHGSAIDTKWEFSPWGVQGAMCSWGPEEGLTEDQTIFIRGFRVYRPFGMLPKQLKGEAGPNPSLDEHEDDDEPDKELVSIPAVMETRDPLHVLSDYIVERSPDCNMVLVHDDDLARIARFRESDETLQPEALMAYLQQAKPEVHQMRYGLRNCTGTATVAMFSEEFHEWNLSPSRVSTVAASQDNLLFYPDGSPVDALRTPLDGPFTRRVQVLGENIDLFRSESFLSDDQKSPPHPVDLDSPHLRSPSPRVTAQTAHDNAFYHNSIASRLDLSLEANLFNANSRSGFNGLNQESASVTLADRFPLSSARYDHDLPSSSNCGAENRAQNDSRRPMSSPSQYLDRSVSPRLDFGQLRIRSTSSYPIPVPTEGEPPHIKQHWPLIPDLDKRCVIQPGQQTNQAPGGDEFDPRRIASSTPTSEGGQCSNTIPEGSATLSTVPLLISTRMETQLSVNTQGCRPTAEDFSDRNLYDTPTFGDPRVDLFCPECGVRFSRVQELERHLISRHLPLWIYCPHSPCSWRGSRKDEFVRHWRVHPSSALQPKSELYTIYDVRTIIHWIVRDKLPVKTASDLALQFVEEKARELEMAEVWTDLWGHQSKARRITSSQGHEQIVPSDTGAAGSSNAPSFADATFCPLPHR